MENAQKQTIVLVDDEEELLQLYKIRLKPLDCHILTFSKSQDFVAYIGAHPEFYPDLVISDFNMPGMTGIEMISAVLKPNIDFPSILLSGYIDKGKAIDAANSGIWNILEKPVEKEQLLSLAKKLLLESRIKNLGKEIRSVTAQLSEMFSAFQILCVDELELESMKRPIIVSSPNSPIAKAQSLEQSLSALQERLNRLAKEEKAIIKMAS